MKKYIFSLLILCFSVLLKAQTDNANAMTSSIPIEGIIIKRAFKEATIFFEKHESTKTNNPSRMESSVYIVNKSGKKEEIITDYFPGVEQLNYANDTVSFIVTVMSGDRFYLLMTKINEKWTIINSGFVANYDNLPQVYYTVKSVAITNMYYTVIEYNPTLNIPVTLLYFNPKSAQIDRYEQIANDKIVKEDTIVSVGGNAYKLVKSNHQLPKYR